MLFPQAIGSRPANLSSDVLAGAADVTCLCGSKYPSEDLLNTRGGKFSAFLQFHYPKQLPNNFG
jgi:hypothetical protein